MIILDAMQPHTESGPCWCDATYLYQCDCEEQGCWKCDGKSEIVGWIQTTDLLEATQHEPFIFIHNDA